jgi:chromosome segregation ATPase
VADDSSDKPSGAQEPILGSSQDLLFGWLVRRASADLGLAEAIAASEARRTEQLRRLEETLTAKVQELQRQPIAETAPAGVVEALKVELETAAARVGSLESTFQQAHQTGESLKADMAKLGERLGEQQSRSEARFAGIETMAETLATKIREFQQCLSAQPPATESFTSAIGDLQKRVQSLTEQMARFEPADSIREAAEREAEYARWTVESDERTALRIRQFGDEIREKLKILSSLQAELQTGRSESAALGERVGEVEDRLRQLSTELRAELSAQGIAFSAEQGLRQAGENSVEELNRRLGARLGDLEAAFHEKLSGVEAQCGDLPSLKGQMLRLSERVAELGRQAENEAAQEAARAERAQGKEEAIATQIGSLAEQFNDQKHASESRSLELGHLRSKLSDLAQRVGLAESAAQQARTLAAAGAQGAEKTAQDLVADFVALKAGLGDYALALKTAQSLMESLESSIGRQFQELQDQLAQTRNESEARDEQLREADRKIDTLAERLVEAEALAHRTHALMVNENTQGAERREGLRMELDELRAQWTRGPAIDATLRAVEEKLNLKIGEWESRLAQRLSLLDYRDAEIRELKTQVQNLGDVLPGTATLNLAAAPAHGVLAMSQSFEKGAEAGVPTDLSGGVSPGGGVAVGGREQMRQLQERISADIERARAELREKSGRSKARR